MIGEVRVNLNDDEGGVGDGYVSGDDVNFDADDIETNHKNGDDDGTYLTLTEAQDDEIGLPGVPRLHPHLPLHLFLNRHGYNSAFIPEKNESVAGIGYLFCNFKKKMWWFVMLLVFCTFCALKFLFYFLFFLSRYLKI